MVCKLLLCVNNTYLKQTTISSLSAGTNGARVSCGFALCMIDFCHLRMSTSISSQLGHFVGFPLCHISRGKAHVGTAGGSCGILLPLSFPPYTHLWAAAEWSPQFHFLLKSFALLKTSPGLWHERRPSQLLYCKNPG